MKKINIVVLVLCGVLGSVSVQADFLQPDSASVTSEYNSNFVLENLFDEGVTAADEAISATDSHVGTAWASSGPDAGTFDTQTIVFDFTTAQDLSAFYLWNMAGSGNAAVPTRGIKTFNLRFYDGAGGRGTELDTLTGQSATQASSSGDYYAETFSFDSVSGVLSVALEITTNFEFDSDGSTSYVGAREVGFEGTASATSTSSRFVYPVSGVSDGGTFSDTYPVSNLFNESVSAGTDTISADDPNSGNGYASSNPPDAGYPVTITVDFASAQELTEFYLWNAAGGGAAGPAEHGIKRFDLLFYDELGGTGTLLDSQLDLEAAASQATGDYAAESFSFPVVSGVQSVQIVIDSNQLEDTSWVGARELGFQGEDSENAAESSEVSKIIVYLLGGQSNADGHGDPDELTGSYATYATPLEDVLFYQGNAGGYSPLTADTWISLQYGSGSKESNAGYFGPELAFGHALNDSVGAVKTKIAIIKHTLGATKLYSDWVAGGDATTDGDGAVYTAFQTTVSEGLAALAALYPDAAIQLEGMLWHQGEGDVNNDMESVYESNLTAFIADVRATYGSELIFGIGQLSDNQGLDADGCDIVQAAQAHVAAASAWNYLVETDDLATDTPDNTIHFPAASLLTIGTRYADGMLAAPLLDADGNGIDDDWEIEQWGESGQDADGNLDEDEYSNLEEFWMDSSPLESNVFEVVIGGDSEMTDLSWVGSASRRYAVERSTNLVSWTAQESYLEGVDGTNSWSQMDTGLTNAFYRIRVQR